MTTTLAVYGHLFPGTDDRLDGILEDARRQAMAAREGVRCGADVVQIRPGAEQGR
jgi:hypothetical protein